MSHANYVSFKKHKYSVCYSIGQSRNLSALLPVLKKTAVA